MPSSSDHRARSATTDERLPRRSEISPAVKILGILNVTPDSFSDGGRYSGSAAVRHGVALAEAGAWAVDVGGESTRPGAVAVPLKVELRRVIPVVRSLVAAGVTVSVDTTKAPVAAAAVDAGASVINDVSGGRADPSVLEVAAHHGVTLVLSHWRGHSDQMAQVARYADVLGEVSTELAAAIDAARLAGVHDRQLVVDPGIGFAKDSEHNWEILRGLPVLMSKLGLPMMIGTSRKRFLGDLVSDAGQPDRRDDLTAVTSAFATVAGVAYLRVHDVVATRRAVAVACAWQDGSHV